MRNLLSVGVVLLIALAVMAAPASAYNLSTTQFEHTLDTSPQDDEPTDVTYNDDGTKLFVVGQDNDNVYEYDLSTPYNISTATFSQSFDVSGQDTQPTDVTFNESGDKMYVVGLSSASVHEYDLTAGYDLSTASFSQSFDVSSEDSLPHGMALNDDGSKMFISGADNSSVFEYDLSTPYDASTASFSQSFDTSSEDSIPFGLAFNQTGSGMFVVGGSNDNVYRYNLTAGFDVSTATFNDSVNVDGQSSVPEGIDFNETGDTMIIAGFSNADIYQYDLTQHGPLVDNSSGTPTGTISERDQTLSIVVNDSDFDDIEGDSVDVEFFVEGSSIGTDTLTANGTATQSHSFSTAGDTNWSVVATDADELTNTSQNFTVTAPSNLTIRKELPPHGKIDDRSVTVTFYEQVDDSPVIVERTTTDGSVDLSGLPAGNEFVARVDANGFNNRSILIDSIFEQQDIFLLNDTEPVINNTFLLQDRTGEFPPVDSSILVQKSLNQSLYTQSEEGFAWVTISGDTFGGDRIHNTKLQEEGRYRLIVRNDEGDQRILGEYTAINSGTVELEAGTVNINYTTTEDNINWGFNQTNVSDVELLRFVYEDPEDETTEIGVLIYERGNRSNVIEDTTFDSGPFGSLTLTKNLTALGETGKSWVLEWNATRGDETLAGNAYTDDSVTVQLPNLDPEWREIIGVLVMLVVAGVFSQANADVGAIALSAVAGIMWMTGFISGVTSGAAIAVAIGLALLYKWSTTEPIG